MFVQRFVDIYPILCISVSFLSFLVGSDASRQKSLTQHIAKHTNFDKGFRESENFRNTSFRGQKEIDATKTFAQENHKQLAEDVLRVYMTAYFLANKVRKYF